MKFCKDCIHYAVCERHAGDIPDSVIEGYKKENCTGCYICVVDLHD